MSGELMAEAVNANLWSSSVCYACGEQYLGLHICTGAPRWVNPSPSWTVQRCPVCEGRGHVQAGFYTYGVATDTDPETCQTCDGKGILKVGMLGSVEKVT